MILPFYSTDFMAPDDTHNGRLEFHEVYSLDLNNTDLVVLSACQTQLRDLSAGDELVGLTRAFFSGEKQDLIQTVQRVGYRFGEIESCVGRHFHGRGHPVFGCVMVLAARVAIAIKCLGV